MHLRNIRQECTDQNPKLECRDKAALPSDENVSLWMKNIQEEAVTSKDHSLAHLRIATPNGKEPSVK